MKATYKVEYTTHYPLTSSAILVPDRTEDRKLPDFGVEKIWITVLNKDGGLPKIGDKFEIEIKPIQ